MSFTSLIVLLKTLYDVVVLPGGLKGANNLCDVRFLIVFFIIFSTLIAVNLQMISDYLQFFNKDHNVIFVFLYRIIF